jgi:hypothetical protein
MMPTVAKKASPTAASVPDRKPGPPLPLGWKDRYVELIGQRGNFYETAELCGVHYKTALRERDRDPDFDAACMEARQLFADKLEHRMLDSAERSDNPAGFIVRLKALRPQEYIEKHAILNLSADLNELPPGDAVQLLRGMLSQTTPSTTKMLGDGQT